MKRKDLRVLIKNPGEDLQEKVINVDLKSLQKNVGGSINLAPMPGGCDDIDMILNKNCQIIRMKPKFLLPEYSDIIVGQIIFVGWDKKRGEHTSLTDQQIGNVIDFIDRLKAPFLEYEFEEICDSLKEGEDLESMFKALGVEQSSDEYGFYTKEIIETVTQIQAKEKQREKE